MTSLREERERRGWKKLRAVSGLEALARESGVHLAQRESLMRQLARWENTTKPASWAGPDEPYRTLFCQLYERTPSDFGWIDTDGTVAEALTFDASLQGSLTTLAELTSADLAQRPGLVSAAVTPTALDAIAMDWLFTPTTDEATTPAARPVSDADVEHIRVATRALDQLERQVGGRYAHDAAVRYLQDRVLPLLGSTHPASTRADLFHAAAVLSELIGWGAYDMGRHALAQRYLTQALRLSRTAGHRTYGAYVLTSLSDQALFLGYPRQALRLAQAAADSSAPASGVRTEAHLLAARAHAAMDDRTGCSDALREAERSFGSTNAAGQDGEATPVSDLIMASHMATCWGDLADTQKAEALLLPALDAMQDQPRRQVYGTIQLARVALLQHDIQRAVALGSRATGTLLAVPSYRSAHHLRALVGQVDDLGPRNDTADFLDQAREVLTAAGTP